MIKTFSISLVFILTISPFPALGNSTTTTTFIHTDHLGGTNVVTDEVGEISQVLDYYPYGSDRISTGSFSEQRTFIGEEKDEESGLSYLNARYYNSSNAKFISQDPVFWEDPLKQNLENPQSLNSYSYAENNPIVKKDPTGRFVQVLALGALYGGVSGAAFQGYADFQAGSLSGLGAYIAAFGNGAAIGFATAINPLVGAGAAGTLSLRESINNNGNITVEGAVNAVVEGAVTGITSGFLKGLPGVSGPQASKVFGGNYFTGSHGMRYAGEAAFGFGVDVYQNNIQGVTNAVIDNSASSYYMNKTYTTPNGKTVDWSGNILSSPATDKKDKE